MVVRDVELLHLLARLRIAWHMLARAGSGLCYTSLIIDGDGSDRRILGTPGMGSNVFVFLLLYETQHLGWILCGDSLQWKVR